MCTNKPNHGCDLVKPKAYDIAIIFLYSRKTTDCITMMHARHVMELPTAVQFEHTPCHATAEAQFASCAHTVVVIPPFQTTISTGFSSIVSKSPKRQGKSYRTGISVAPVAYQVILEPGIGQFREFEFPRVHTRINS